MTVPPDDAAPTEAITLTVTVDRDAGGLYEMLWRPESFPLWASGLSAGDLRFDGAEWQATGQEGTNRIRFTPHNAFGVMDHWVETRAVATVSVPLRIVPNGRGSEVMLTLFRQPGMDDARFAADAEWVRRDLVALKALAEQRS